MPAFQPPGPCPACHEHVPARRPSCPHCGSTAQDGWSPEVASDGLDLPDEAFDHEDFVAREFGEERPDPRRRQNPGLSTGWILVALGLAALFAGMGWFALR